MKKAFRLMTFFLCLITIVSILAGCNTAGAVTPSSSVSDPVDLNVPSSSSGATLPTSSEAVSSSPSSSELTIPVSDIAMSDTSSENTSSEEEVFPGINEGIVLDALPAQDGSSAREVRFLYDTTSIDLKGIENTAEAQAEAYVRYTKSPAPDGYETIDIDIEILFRANSLDVYRLGTGVLYNAVDLYAAQEDDPVTGVVESVTTDGATYNVDVVTRAEKLPENGWEDPDGGSNGQYDGDETRTYMFKESFVVPEGYDGIALVFTDVINWVDPKTRLFYESYIPTLEEYLDENSTIIQLD